VNVRLMTKYGETNVSDTCCFKHPHLRRQWGVPSFPWRVGRDESQVTIGQSGMPPACRRMQFWDCALLTCKCCVIGLSPGYHAFFLPL
jgi:hypothetical protein